MNKILKLSLSIFICLGAGFIGSVVTTPSIPTWYAVLQKPAFNPPNWIFAPVWTVLYILMGISAYLIWDKGFRKKEVKIALLIFGLQLILNSFWSIIFFGWHLPLYAFIELILLWLAILWTIIYFYRISRSASYLLMPYILWVSFAAALNFSILLINR